METDKICSENFTGTFCLFDRHMNAFFQKKTELLSGGSIREPKNSDCYTYGKKLVSKENVVIEIDILYDKMKDDYIYYNYNIFFNKNKLMFHYEPTHREHFQPHINVYVEEKELKNLSGESIHIISHKYHPFEILALIKRYFG
ncbi:MAG: hypothetical protein HQK78_17665 [Desulfobacterales bacterium]|nr:hypothetical protein [Desulfobacterales bacterium]